MISDKKIPALIILACLQLALPAYLIINREFILAYGDEIRLKTAPVDPYDAFRGKYITLSYQEQSVLADKDASASFSSGNIIYAVFNLDDKRNGTLAGVTARQPASGLYIKCKITSTYFETGTGKNRVYISFPFDRYYLTEEKALKAEAVYREQTRTAECYALIRVHDGQGVIADIILDGQPIMEYLKQ